MPLFKLDIEGHQSVFGNLELPVTLQYYSPLHDIQMGGVRSCAPCPEVYNLGEPDDNNNSYKIFLNEKWQFFSFGLFAKVAYQKKIHELTDAEYDYLAQKWTNVMASNRAFTNGNGSWVNHNYITGENVGEPDIAYDKVRTCGAARLTGTEILNSFKRTVLRVDTFDIRFDPPNIDLIDPYTDSRIFFANIVQQNGTVKRFSQLSGEDAPTPFLGHDVPIPIISDHPVHYPLSRLRKLPLGSPIPSAYLF